MEFTITFVQRSLFQDYIPVIELTVYAEEMRYALEGFEREYPELELLDIY